MEILLTSHDRWLIIIQFQWLVGGGCKRTQSLTQLVGNDKIRGALFPLTDGDRQHVSSKKPSLFCGKTFRLIFAVNQWTTLFHHRPWFMPVQQVWVSYLPLDQWGPGNERGHMLPAPLESAEVRRAAEPQGMAPRQSHNSDLQTGQQKR